MDAQARDELWIRRTVQLAQEARDRGDDPFGALLAHNGEVVLEARNAVNTERDITQHAELRLISKASSQLDCAVVAASTLYTSTEPCRMCAGAIYWARVPRVVFGFPASNLRAMSASASSPARTSIEGPVLEEVARSVHEGYW